MASDEAMPNVAIQEAEPDFVERRSDRIDLGEDVDAIAVLLDHAREAAHLALDPAQSFGAGCLDVVSHDRYIPLHGIRFNPSLQDRQ